MYYKTLSKKFNNPLLQVKIYWSKLEKIYNKKKNSLIQPLLVNGKFATVVKAKACIFNKFLAEPCTSLKNDSVLPVNQIFLSQSRLNSLDFNEDETLKIIRALNIYKL